MLEASIKNVDLWDELQRLDPGGTVEGLGSESFMQIAHKSQFNKS